ncbi:hypothetical protein DYB28_001290 [Aphanomyces astaci]|uniref:2-oxoglutarate reductase n=1 Tax=Aphanomyces astaci TaxID=112090 RepID=A0A397CVD1_APHAT|nr:hypothetical protein DYB38_009345 [Aphanomyces astaci]RHY64172.1 hypothetical protein DYB30_000326 [Aphanomyces astaci]RLN94874.1 hypothetical protein DYB28_001290 [Aphanomyces astaci]RQM10378.1 hypothetical protein B5M09_001526 [Aphanomyces astaci]
MSCLHRTVRRHPSLLSKTHVAFFSSYLDRPTSFPLKKVKVVLLENIHPRAIEIFENEGYTIETYKGALSGQELIDVAGDANILGIRSKTQLDRSFFESIGWHNHRLWAVGCFCIGTNQVDLAGAAKYGVPVFNAPFSNTRSVAEKTLCEIIALQRKLFERSTDLHTGLWKKSATGAHEVRGTTLGIIGYGRIGSQVSVLAELLGMKVVFYDPLKCLPLGNATQLDSLQELLQVADGVTLHVPATSDTKNMINADTIQLMKPGSFVINNARGTVVDLHALADALKSGHLSGVRFLNEGTSTTATNIPEVDLGVPVSGNIRILHMHHNVPGVLSKIHAVLSDYGINVSAQFLQSNSQHSYIILEVEPFHAKLITRELKKIKETIFLRALL